MLRKHLDDALDVLVEWEPNGMGPHSAIYHQLHRLAQATAKALGVDFEAEWARRMEIPAGEEHLQPEDLCGCSHAIGTCPECEPELEPDAF